MRVNLTPKVIESYWTHVAKTDTCWVWTGATSSGYGSFRNEGAHRVSWVLHYGSIPDGLWVLHHCDFRPCVRPNHLFIGTPSDNTQDMIAKGRGNFTENKASGEQHWRCKLTESDVAMIRAIWPTLGRGDTKRLAEQLGVDRTQIWRVARGLRRNS